jgi:hypothetical protein
MQSDYTPLTGEQFLHPVNNLPRLVHDLLQQSLKCFAGRVFHIHLAFFRLLNKTGISHGFSVGFARVLNPIRLGSRRGDHWSTEVSTGENHPRQLAPHIGVLYWSIDSKSVGVSANLGSRFGPP